ncbi:MAG: hypothetical protein KKB66_00400 [Alphaproteobacteria bacterium]|nr:hypothetical protein [Alphaproteobacteria bacterium]MBU0803271.1 hypothetical protein [Alphaproteobacteria bacterium]MBU0870795.1 hypothetical protein [Alphaproteobacteria bacterium]MBU1403767.1 hypothetical protein [Alphaproteobacteria bacterium]MBU1589602.1 hypothetical protein [Alphaproteobacteria bacterium]
MDTRQLREVGRRAAKAAEQRQILETGRASAGRARHLFLRYTLLASAVLIVIAGLWLVVSMLAN